MQKAAKNNPMLSMYVKSLSDTGKVFVSCNDFKNHESHKHQFHAFKNSNASFRYFLSAINILFKWLLKGNMSASGSIEKFFIRFFSNLSFVIVILEYYLKNVLLLLHALKYLIKNKPDIIFALDADYLAAASWASKMFSCKSVYLVYEIWPEQFSATTPVADGQKRAYYYIEKKIISSIDRIITVDTTWSTFICRLYAVPRGKFSEIAVCPERSAVSYTPFCALPIKVAYHGVYLLSRGLSELLHAIAETQDIHLYLRGYGPDEIAIRELVNKLSIADKVVFLEPVPTECLVESSLDFDIGVILAKPDTANGRMCTGFKYFEYMNSGLMVIAPSSHPLKRLIKLNNHGKNYGWPEIGAFKSVLNAVKEAPSQINFCKEMSEKASAKYSFYGQKSLLLELVHELVSDVS